MQFTYKPEGAEPQTWAFNPDKLLNAECIEIEKRTGWDYGEWLQRFRGGNVTAITAFLFIMLKRKHHQLKWEDVRFTLDEVELEADPEEKAIARRELEAIPEDERSPEISAALRMLVEEGIEPAPPEGEDPKG